MSKLDYWTQICALTWDKGLERPSPEYRFAPPRRWRFDYAWVEQKVALEVEGGIWIKGRHTRGAGVQKDMEKYNEAAILGWRVIRCTPGDLWTGIEAVSRCLRDKEAR